MNAIATTNTPVTQLPLPPFYNSKNAGNWGYHFDQQELFEQAQAWRKQHNIGPAAAQKLNVHLLVIDGQKDFCHHEGSLFVGGRSGTGAIDDNDRTAQFIYRHLGLIKNMTFTFDTHFAFQIFFNSFWIDERGQPLSPHTMIRLSDNGRTLVNVDGAGKILHENVKPNPEAAWFLCGGDVLWLERQARFYCEELAKSGKYILYLWPYHTILGSDGHALTSILHEARMFFSFVRASQSWSEVKGGNFLSENYSVLRPEVLMRFDKKPLAQRNTRFYETLISSDVVIIAGQAKSHCVNFTIDDLIKEIMVHDPKLADKVYIATDLMSSVTVPDGQGGFLADFTDPTDQAFLSYAQAGVHLVNSTDPIETWPGIRL